MKKLFHLLIAGACFAYAPMASAANWTKVAENSVNDKFFIDTSSIQRNGTIVWYWEYREFPQPNNAFVEATVNQPVQGAVIRWSVDCTNKAQRLRKLNVYTKNRQLIQKFEYGDTGALTQSKPGSSAYAVANYACMQKEETQATLEKPAPKNQQKPAKTP